MLGCLVMVVFCDGCWYCIRKEEKKKEKREKNNGFVKLSYRLLLCYGTKAESVKQQVTMHVTSHSEK